MTRAVILYCSRRFPDVRQALGTWAFLASTPKASAPSPPCQSGRFRSIFFRRVRFSVYIWMSYIYLPSSLLSSLFLLRCTSARPHFRYLILPHIPLPNYTTQECPLHSTPCGEKYTKKSPVLVTLCALPVPLLCFPSYHRVFCLSLAF